jgi:hypothetical protein
MSSGYARRRRLAICSSEQSSSSCVLICCRNQEPASFRDRHDCRARAAVCVCALCRRDRGHSVLLIVLGARHDTFAVFKRMYGLEIKIRHRRAHYCFFNIPFST